MTALESQGENGMVRVLSAPRRGHADLNTAGDFRGWQKRVAVGGRAIPVVAALALALALAACTTRPALIQPFPNPPVDLASPLPSMAVLKPNAQLSDIMAAHLADAQAFGDLKAEVVGWRDWYAKQAAAWK